MPAAFLIVVYVLKFVKNITNISVFNIQLNFRNFESGYEFF